jgi:hypothetical protein
MRRYADAYGVAKAIVALGQSAKILSAFVLGGLVLGGLIASGQGVGGGLAFAIGLIAGPLVALPIYLLGIIVSAQGQTLMATLDTAVHTSPFLTNEDKQRILSWDQPPEATSAPSPPQTAPVLRQALGVISEGAYLAGRVLYYSNGTFSVEGTGPVGPRFVGMHEDSGQIAWSTPETRAFALERCGEASD